MLVCRGGLIANSPLQGGPKRGAVKCAHNVPDGSPAVRAISRLRSVLLTCAVHLAGMAMTAPLPHQPSDLPQPGKAACASHDPGLLELLCRVAVDRVCAHESERVCVRFRP